MRQALLDPELVRLSGSCSDGGGTCRWFRQGLADFEMDVMYQVGKVPADKEDAILVMLLEKPGFAKLRKCPETYASLHPLLARYRPELSEQFDVGGGGGGTPSPPPGREEFVNTFEMQEFAKAVMPHRDEDGEIPRIAAALMEVDESELGIFVEEKVEGPSVMTELVISLREDPKVLYSSDSVLSFKLERWPELLNQWLRRDPRFWPAKEQLDACAQQGCHLVAKKSPTETTANTEWRLSFSSMEEILMKSWNDHQELCYYFLKSLFYKHIRGIEVDKHHIPSYALKSEMFWAIEQTDPSEWTEANLKKNALRVLGKLESGLRAGFIPNYFLPSMNVIHQGTYPRSLVEQVAARVALINGNLEEYIPRDLEKMARLGRSILTVMNSVLAYIRFTTIKVRNQKQIFYKIHVYT